MITKEMLQNRTRGRKRHVVTIGGTIEWTEGFCFFLIALNLLWAFWADTPLKYAFSPACIALFVLLMIHMVLVSGKMRMSMFAFYAAFVIWAILMILVYDQNPMHSTSTFLMFRSDGYAVFFLQVLVCVLPAMIYVDIHEFKIGKGLKWLMVLILLVTLAFAIRVLLINPNAIRADRMMKAQGYGAFYFGTPTYAITYAYSILFPLFLHKSLHVSKGRLPYVLCAVLIAVVVTVTQFATALLMLLAGVLVYFYIVSKPVVRVFLVMLAFLFGIIFLATDTGVSFLLWIADRAEGDWAVKLEDLAYTISGQYGGDSVTGRATLYGESFSAFGESPLLGKFVLDSGPIGGHATAIDILGLTGIVGFVPFIMTISGNFKRMKAYPSYESARPAVIACVAEFVMMVFLKNIVSSMAVFFAFYVLVPFLFKAEEKSEEA